jgi:hypothetical protein
MNFELHMPDPIPHYQQLELYFDNKRTRHLPNPTSHHQQLELESKTNEQRE